jgi:RNA polymerase sigma factor (sigma-70 family)
LQKSTDCCKHFGHECWIFDQTEGERSNSRGIQELAERAIEDLPLHYRESLLLCEVEEMSYQEIAEILSTPTETVMARLARARK